MTVAAMAKMMTVSEIRLTSIKPGMRYKVKPKVTSADAVQ